MTSPVRKQSPAVEQMAEDWPIIDALMGGTKAMRRAGKKYLPQWPAEDEKSYEMRLATATVFPAYSRTVSVLTGKPFSKPVSIGEDVPPRLATWLEDDADLQGRNLHAFAADICAEALAYGLCGILVDYPPATNIRTVADERQTGVRPYFVHVRHDSILGWNTARVNGSTVLSQLRLLETVEEPDDDYGVKTVSQVRVLTPGGWATFRKAKPADDDSWEEIDRGVTTLKVIPFVPVYGTRQAYMVGVAPMLELAHTNVEHWQSKSDQQTILHVARVPILFAKDLDPDKITVGGGSYICASSPDADLKYVEHSGKAIESGRMSLLDLEDRMRQIGAELLVIKPGHQTVVQTVSDNEQGMCDLQRIMQSAEDALDQALGLMAQWVGEPEGGHVTIYRDFGAATLAEASAALLFDMNSTGKLSNATMINELKRRGVLSADVDTNTEIAAAKVDAPPVPPVTTELVKP